MFMQRLVQRLAMVMLALSSVFYSNQILAVGLTNGGTIVHVTSTTSGALLFTIKNGVQQSPMAACATSGRYGVDAKGPNAAVVLVAFTTGKTLHSVKGTGVCNHYSNSEDVEWVAVCPISGC